MLSMCATTKCHQCVIYLRIALLSCQHIHGLFISLSIKVLPMHICKTVLSHKWQHYVKWQDHKPLKLINKKPYVEFLSIT